MGLQRRFRNVGGDDKLRRRSSGGANERRRVGPRVLLRVGRYPDRDHRHVGQPPRRSTPHGRDEFEWRPRPAWVERPRAPHALRPVALRPPCARGHRNEYRADRRPPRHRGGIPAAWCVCVRPVGAALHPRRDASRGRRVILRTVRRRRAARSPRCLGAIRHGARATFDRPVRCRASDRPHEGGHCVGSAVRPDGVGYHVVRRGECDGR